ncbi:unnamed protein product [Leptidea sinapis]|uniref:Uncharacterized protein n=1 Tax=Leptidea sinapis TaxID=189913 RepID=A0A5E4PQ81_9NEOP|nr:unnamed protein product [Leptidea sinapis]
MDAINQPFRSSNDDLSDLCPDFSTRTTLFGFYIPNKYCQIVKGPSGRNQNVLLRLNSLRLQCSMFVRFRNKAKRLQHARLVQLSTRRKAEAAAVGTATEAAVGRQEAPVVAGERRPAGLLQRGVLKPSALPSSAAYCGRYESPS